MDRMLPVKEAVRESVKTFSELYAPEMFRDIRLEEVSISEDEKTWQVTLSYRNPDYRDEVQSSDEATKNLLRMTGWSGPPTRHYKTVALNASDGSLLSVKNAS